MRDYEQRSNRPKCRIPGVQRVVVAARFVFEGFVELMPLRANILSLYVYQVNALITPSKATSAIAFAGKARKKQGTKPLQYPFQP